MNNHPLTPILLFTYLRLDKLKKTIIKLSENYLASESDLIIFSDNAKKYVDTEKVKTVRSYLQTITGFKSVTIYESNEHKGLANSIIQGVDKVFTTHNTVIVLEDDLITSKNFLNFMNQSLMNYKHQENIYSISGYSHDLGYLRLSDEDGYFLNRPWSWGWGTWKNRWEGVDWAVKDYTTFKNNRKDKKGFAQLGSDVNKMLEKQINGKIDSWAIRWIYHIYKNNGLIFYPNISKINNNGWDKYANNNKGINRYLTVLDNTNKEIFDLPNTIKVHPQCQKAFLKKMNFTSRVINKLKEIFQL